MILSICIPSYNRFEKLNETISDILQAKSNDFEIVIIDNCSPRNIEEHITSKDKRLRIVKRETPVYGGKSVADSILFARGKYALMLLDKDTINGDKLDDFISILNANEGISGGYCVLNSKKNEVTVVNENIVAEFGYLSKHPSGNFYKIACLREYVNRKEEEMEKDPFAFDVYMAYCASLGRMMKYDKPLVCSLLDNMSKKEEKSLTFDMKKGNVYYLIPNRLSQFKVYLSCLKELNIEKSEKKSALFSLYRRTINHVTIEYRHIMKNKEVCNHYGHEPEKVNMFKILYNVLCVRKILVREKIEGINYFEKLGMDFKIFYSKIRNKLCKSKNGD